MDLEFPAGRWTAGSSRRGPALILAAIVAALTIAIAAPAQATPNVAKAWGNNDSGELGTGTTVGPEQCGTEAHSCSTTPLQVRGLSGVDAVSNGEEFALALLENGTVMAWGYNADGELGNGTTTNSDVPVAVKELSSVKAIAAGDNHGLAVLENGTVMAWGLNNQGALGNGTTTSSDVPVTVCAPAPEPCPGSQLKTVKAIAAGSRHSLALLENGTVVAWGQNTQGQLGNGTTTNSDVPVAVKGLSGAKAIVGGANHSLALLENGTVKAWGWDVRGQLGDGLEANSDVPVAVCAPGAVAPCAAHLEHVASISAGQYHSLALLSSGQVVAWGANEAGQLGDGTSTGPETCELIHACAKVPVEVSKLAGVSAISAGLRHSLALSENGNVMAWGLNRRGQLGDGISTGPEPCEAGSCSTTPVAVCAEGAEKVLCSKGGPFLVGAKGIGAGGEFSLAFGPPPTVTAVKPKKGPAGGGTTVTITGTNFTGATAVKFGSTNATSFTVNSPTSITAVSPAEPAGRVDVTVTTSWGTSATSKVDHFSFTPTVTGLSSNSGPAAGGTSLTVTGTGFATGTTATRFRFGRTLATSVNCASSTTCTVTSPAHPVGTVDVKAIVNHVASPRNRPGDQFTYN